MNSKFFLAVLIAAAIFLIIYVPPLNPISSMVKGFMVGIGIGYVAFRIVEDL